MILITFKLFPHVFQINYALQVYGHWSVHNLPFGTDRPCCSKVVLLCLLQCTAHMHLVFILFSNFERYYFSGDILHSALQWNMWIAFPSNDSEVEANCQSNFLLCLQASFMAHQLNVSPSLCLHIVHLMLCVYFLRELPCWSNAEIKLHGLDRLTWSYRCRDIF